MRGRRIKGKCVGGKEVLLCLKSLNSFLVTNVQVMVSESGRASMDRVGYMSFLTDGGPSNFRDLLDADQGGVV